VNADGFGILKLDTTASGTITVPAGISLDTSSGGQISFEAANITIDGSISAPSGTLSFDVFDISPTASVQFTTPAADPTRGLFTLGAGASLSSTGLIVDDRPGTTSPSALPFATGGGKISIAGLDVNLAAGSTIDVSGGLSIDSSGNETYGNAGSISILGGQDPRIASLVNGGELFLGSTLAGYSGAVGGGGTLTIQAPLVQIGGSSLLNGDSSSHAFVQGEASVTGNGTTLWLDPAAESAADFFSQGGFETFTVEGLGQIETTSGGAYMFNSAGDPVISPAVLIASGTNISPVVQSYAADFTGANIMLSPLASGQESRLLSSQRTPVNLIFNAEGVSSNLSNDGPPEADGTTYLNSGGGSGLLVRGDLVMQAGSSITTAAQTNSSHGVSLLAAHGMVAVLGSINAPAGTITITGGNTASVTNNQLLFYESSLTQPFPTVDLGPGSVLSTAGVMEQTPNSLGFTTGSVLAGGNIVINGNIVAEQGATLDVSGASGVVDQTLVSLGQSIGRITSAGYVPTTVESNGGSITFNASQLLYSDATLLGSAGGPSAQGGTLSVSSGFADTVLSSTTPPVPQDISLIVSQQGLNGGFSLPADSGSGLAVVDEQAIPGSDSEVGATINNTYGGEPVYSYFAANSNLFVSTTSNHTASNNGGQAGGFSSLNLAGTLDFIGPVNITASRSINLAQSSGNTSSGETGGVIYADSPVVVTAPYIALNSYVTASEPDQITGYPVALGGAGSLTVNASTLADVGNLSLQDISTLNFNTIPGLGGDIRGTGTLQVADQINLNAAQIYPPTADTFTVEANDVSITAPSGEALPYLPLSAGGTLDIYANTIEQGGVLRAPFGVINLGTSATQSITLSSGSITSVSGVDPKTGLGITVPYGIVDDNGTWYDPNGNNISLTGPMAKAVNVTSQNVDLQSGSTIDLAGGGNLFAYQFTPGTGGNKDILASTGSGFSSTSFAIVPGYSSSYGYAPDGTYAISDNLLTNNVQDIGYYNSSLAVGEQIHLNASSGLPAGTYTLLPARYALLPGAFLVSATSGGAPGTSLLQSDGSSFVSGYVTSALNSTASPIYSSFQLYSQANVLNRAPYTINLANTYFPSEAANNDLSVPRLPIDSGQLLLDATQSMTIQGTLLSQAPVDGLGGEVDIASPEAIYIVGPNTVADAPTGALVLDSSQLTDFGAASLLIGGYRTTTDTGTSVTVTTSDLVVDNSGASTVVNGVSVAGLAAPDIILASNENLEVDNGSAIEQLGQLSGGAQALTLQGDGVLLRLSSDPSASIVRQNVSSGDTTSALSIGQGVTIRDASGGAAGSLTLDSSSLLSISTSTVAPPVLSATVLTLDSSLINIELGTPATAPTSGLVITQPLLDSLLSSTQSLSLLSYSSIALYGNGEIGSVSIDESGQKTYQEQNLSLHADDIYYADTQDSSGITINAQNVSLDNLSDGTLLPSLGGLGASNLTVNAQTISLGSNAMRMDQFTSVALNADSAILLRGLGSEVSGSDNAPTPASLNVGGNLTLTTPLITSATAPDQTVADTTSVELDEAINATGSLTIEAPVNDLVVSPGTGALGATLSLSADSLDQNSGSIVLHSGKIDLQATGASASPGAGAILVNGTLDVSGVAPTFFSLNKFTDGGQIALNSLNGNVAMGSNGLINVSAVSGPGTVDSGAGNAGSLTISAAGLFTPGLIVGGAGQVTQSGTVIAQGSGGTLSLDVGSLDASGAGNGLLSSLENSFVGFDQQSIRDRNDTTVIVGDTVRASSFDLSADTGSIEVTGTIDASNVATTDAAGNLIYVGGSIELDAGANVILAPTSVLNASGINFSDAGKGGSITLVSGAYRNVNGADITDYNGYVDIQGNSTSAAQINLSVAANNGAADSGDSVALGHYTGTLLIEAPRTADNTGVQVHPIDGTITGASSIAVAGNEVYTTDSSGDINGNGVDLPTQIMTDADNFLGAAGQSASANYSAMASSLFGNLDAASQNVASIEAGVEIVNPSGDLNLASNWDLSTFRFGPTSGAGVLTLRAAGNINVDFGASLTDGFDGSSGVSYTNVLLPAGSQSWSYNLVAGADLSAANANQVQTASQLQLSGLDGSLQLGYQNGSAPIVLSNSTTDDPSQFFQAIRTGTGNISISAGGDVLLLNELATIYTAGSQVDPTLGGTFVAPSGTGLNQQALPATYSAGGGNVVIAAQGNIERETYGGSSGTQLVADSSPELPTNWLDREGSASAGIPTTWWVDFTNFFEGVGALGGGNVSLTAQGSVVNVDAAIPTNGRVVNGALNELGGGDLVVRAGNNIDGGVYYVEQGQGTVAAGNNILTNATRAAVTLGQPSTSIDWLPTTLFLGTGDFSVSAGGNLLLGPVANPFLLPQSFNNVASPLDLTSELSYFSTYAPTDAVNASALSGTLTIQDFADGQAQGSLYSWYTNILDSSVTSPQLGSVLSAAEPWLRLAEATTPQHIVSYFGAAGTLPLGSPSNIFGGVTALMPPTLRATAFSGDLDLIGSLTLSPSSSGTVDLVAAGSINAFQTNADLYQGVFVDYSGSALVNLSDANPNALPGINDPLTSASQLVTLDPLFTDTGATEGLTLQTKQKLHADINGGSLHANDPNPDPAYIYADSGNISGLTLFSAKEAQVIAGQNISDIGLYIQNNNSSDISVVSAGRDIIAYDANSPLRVAAGTSLLGYDPQSELLGEGAGGPNSGDIQISGPGTLEVLTGRNLTLGNDAGQNPNASVAGDGLDTGLTSVGGQLNPALPFDGANIVAAAGLGTGLAVAGLVAQNDSLTFSTFISEFLNPASSFASTYLPVLASYLGLGDSSNQQIWSNFNSLSSAHQDTLALDIFYQVLSDTATNHNDPTSSGFGNYNTGFQAVSALFPANNPYQGDINLTSREVKTSNGGDIDMIVPGGQVTVGVDQADGQAVDQGILTVDGGNVNIFGSGSVLVGTSRIFTLHGGNETIWSTNGNIDAGASSKTVVSAPPTRVVVDPTSGAVTTDLAGLSTGGGIGVLASVVGAPPGNIYLIAPNGTVDAGDAGIRASGNIDIAAQTIANASNISSGGSTTGVSAGASVNLGALSAASSAAGSSEAAANNNTPGHQNVAASTQDTPSIITVEVLGYGGGDND
jgi:filamentous hemagglutinin